MQFSKRSAEIEAWLAATGTAEHDRRPPSRRVGDPSQQARSEPERLDDGWKVEAESLGWGPAHAEGLVVASMRRNPTEIDDVWRLETVGLDEHGNTEVWERTVTPDEWITDLLRRDLTADRTTFTRPELTTSDRGSGSATVRPSTPSNDSPVTSSLPRTRSPSSKLTYARRHGPPERSSRSSNNSSALSDIAATSRCQTAWSADCWTRGRTSATIERTAVHQICTSTAAVAVLVGPAGTGKTYTIDTIRSIFETAGIAAAGAAPSRRRPGLRCDLLRRWAGRRRDHQGRRLI